MPIQVASKATSDEIPQFMGLPNIRISDVHGSTKTEGNEKPITTSYFYLSKTDQQNEPFPAYTYDETGVVLEGSLILEDEQKTKKILKAGDTFFIARGSVVSFDTEDFALVLKVGGRWPGEY